METLLTATSVFLDKHSYKRCLDSIPSHIDHLCIDGKYRDFHYPLDLSDDGTRYLVINRPNSVIRDAINKNEVEKRQIYFDNFNPDKYKFLCVIDSDEYFVGNWDDFICELNDLYDKMYERDIPKCIGIYVRNSIQNQFDPRPRIWMNAHKIITGPKHADFRNKNTNEALYFSNIINSMKIEHDYKLRLPDYTKLREEYQEILIDTEDKMYSK